ncbi:hypothetical protein G6011_11775 [Alternaria panax]|uniref:Uncharacterized protein n=1 Tax=Alternaria panax TaxID=48097 RepID=A0AAD4F7U7_9PLEO|nr:hypothetical protein G6011_11775 [Alternaria panax]
MAPIDLDDGTWTVDALKTKLETHPLFSSHGMEMPAKILEHDLKSAARLFDQHDSSTKIADGKAPRPLAYHDKFYTVNPDLRPMAAAADLRNTHGKEFSNGGLARWLQRWDVDHAPRIAMFLPRQKQEGKSVVPKKVDQTQNKTEAESTKSIKRKAMPTKPYLPLKRQNRARTTAEDDDVEMHNRDESDDDTFLPQPATKGSTSTRTLCQKQTSSYEPRNGPAFAPETRLDAKKGRGRLAPAKIADHLDDDLMDDTADYICDEGDKDFDTDAGSSSGLNGGRSGLGTKATRNGKARKKNTNAGTARTAEGLVDERQREEDEEELRIYRARRPGRYSDPVLADAYRVNYKTVFARMEGHIRPGVEPAPSDQLGTRRLYEREVDQAKEEGRDLDLWMGGPSP